MAWLPVAAAAISAVGALQAGEAAQNAANYNAAMAEAEARAEETRRRAEGKRALASTRAGIAKSGAAFEGTPLMVLAESAANAEIDALNAQWSGKTQSIAYRAQGQQARTASYFQAGTSLLTGAHQSGYFAG